MECQTPGTEKNQNWSSCTPSLLPGRNYFWQLLKGDFAVPVAFGGKVTSYLAMHCLSYVLCAIPSAVILWVIWVRDILSLASLAAPVSLLRALTLTVLQISNSQGAIFVRIHEHWWRRFSLTPRMSKAAVLVRKCLIWMNEPDSSLISFMNKMLGRQVYYSYKQSSSKLRNQKMQWIASVSTWYT